MSKSQLSPVFTEKESHCHFSIFDGWSQLQVARCHGLVPLPRVPISPVTTFTRLRGAFPTRLRRGPAAHRSATSPALAARRTALAEEVGAGGPVCSPCALVLYQNNPGAFPTPASRSRGSATPHCCFAACAEMSWGQEPERGPGGPCVPFRREALQPGYTGEGGATET